MPGDCDLEMCGRHEEAIRRLDGWQKEQNGSILRVEAKVDAVEAKIDGQRTWLIALLGGLVVDLLTRLLSVGG